MNNNNKITGNQYLDKKNKLLRSKLFKFDVIVLFLLLFSDLLFLFLNKFYLLLVEIDGYFLAEIICYYLLSFICLFICHKIINNVRISNNLCNWLFCFFSFFLFAGIAFIHYELKILWIVPGISIFIGCIFADRRIMTTLYICSIISQVIYLERCIFVDGKVILEYVLYAAIGIVIFTVYYIIAHIYTEYIGNRLEDIKTYYDGEKELKIKLETEYLTGLYSRSAINNILSDAVHDAYFYKNKLLSVVMIDIDFFKKINDNYGHANGDLVLKRLADVMKEYVDDNISAGRVGGEEFLIVIRNLPKNECKQIIKGMLKNFSEQKFEFLPDGQSITFSAGMSWLSNDDFDQDELVACADRALYYSKEHGRNQITEYEQMMLEADK